MAADRIRLSEPAPAHCSSCFSQKPQKRHVDFGAAWDGPVVPGNGVVQHVIDDLIICEECLVRAGNIIGMGFVEEVEAELHRAETENDGLLMQVKELREYIRAKEEADATRPAFLDEPKRTRKKVAA